MAPRNVSPMPGASASIPWRLFLFFGFWWEAETFPGRLWVFSLVRALGLPTQFGGALGWVSPGGFCGPELRTIRAWIPERLVTSDF